MKYTFLALFFLVKFNFSSAQQNHFLYLQTENKQPFYLKMNKNIFNSTSVGYLILPKLVEGHYDITIGFPKNQWPEQFTSLDVQGKDVGYLLKNFGEKGWGLFNLQSLRVITLQSQNKTDKNVAAQTGDEFSNMLANVVNDPSIRKEEVVQLERTITMDVSEKKTEDEKVPQKNATSPELLKKGVHINLINKTLLEKQGLSLTYIDEINGAIDTIHVFIAPLLDQLTIDSEKEKSAQLRIDEKKEQQKLEQIASSNLPAPYANEDKPVDKYDSTKAINSAEEKIKLEATKSDDAIVVAKALVNQKTPVEINNLIPSVQKANPVTIVTVAANTPLEQSPQKLQMINSDCRAFATDDDFLKLRKKMAAETEEDKMMTLAKKAFKTKCFTTEQIKNLSVLFLKDSSRYFFFDTAYPFVSDSTNYQLLESQLTDVYYISRFKAMIRH